MWERFVRSVLVDAISSLKQLKAIWAPCICWTSGLVYTPRFCLFLLCKLHDSSRSRGLRTDSQQFASHVRSNEGAIDMLWAAHRWWTWTCAVLLTYAYYQYMSASVLWHAHPAKPKRSSTVWLCSIDRMRAYRMFARMGWVLFLGMKRIEMMRESPFGKKTTFISTRIMCDFVLWLRVGKTHANICLAQLKSNRPHAKVYIF